MPSYSILNALGILHAQSSRPKCVHMNDRPPLPRDTFSDPFAAGKPKKLALTVLMRKLILLPTAS